MIDDSSMSCMVCQVQPAGVETTDVKRYLGSNILSGPEAKTSDSVSLWSIIGQPVFRHRQEVSI